MIARGCQPDGQTPERKTALLLVDYLQRDRGRFTYEHGTLSEGIAKTVSVIEAAHSLGLPVILIAGRITRELFPEIENAAGPRALRIFKSKMDAFTEPDLETFLNALDINAVAIGGWTRHLCVTATANSALGRGFPVLTSDEILFGNREIANLGARRISLDFFKRECELYGTSSDLVLAMSGGNPQRVTDRPDLFSTISG